MRELARLRNEAARSLGYRDWFALAVATSEMDETRLFADPRRVRRAHRPSRSQRGRRRLDARLAKRFGCDAAELASVALRGPVLPGGARRRAASTSTRSSTDADLVALARRTFDGIGLDTAPILERSDLFPRDGKCQHAFCIDVDREGDVRVLANVAPDRYWADTMLHELGHGVFDLGIDGSLPWLLRDCHLTLTEGIAMLMGRLAQDAELASRRRRRRSRPRPAELEARLARGAARPRLLVFTRWVLVMTNFERALYADPEADLDALWWELVARYQLLRRRTAAPRPTGRPRSTSRCAPVYYHTYLYGNLVASQLRATLEREAGGLVGRREAGTAPRRAGLPPGRVRALGPAARAGDRRAADRGAPRPRHRGRAGDLRWPAPSA